MLVRNNPVSLYQQIADQLRSSIARREFEPTGRLPSEAEMVEKFGVSRVTVRLALESLERESLIERRKGKGTFVAGKHVRHQVDTLRSFHETLKMHGLDATMRLVNVHVMDTPTTLEGYVGKRCALVERLHLVSGVAIALGRSFLPVDVADLEKSDIEKRPTYALVEDRAGRPIASAEIAIGARTEKTHITSTLDVEPNAFLLVMERTSYFDDGTCAEHSEFFIRPEQYKFIIKNR